MTGFLALTLSVIMGSVPNIAAASQPPSTIIQAIKNQERGPFSRLRWFCKDGSVLPPKAYACADHGGGYQHGEYSAQTAQLRGQGIYIANIWAGTDPAQWLANNEEQLRWALVERFLVEADNGWIYRRSHSYGGAIQTEDEAEGARTLLTAMVRQPRYLTTHYLLLREAARLLPWQAAGSASAEMRSLSADLGDNLPAFAPIRNKLHGAPAASDIAAVKAFAGKTTDSESLRKLNLLVAALERLFAPVNLSEALRKNAAGMANAAAPEVSAAALKTLADQWEAAQTPEARLRTASLALKTLRQALPAALPASRLLLVATSLEAERAAFVAGQNLLPIAESVSRADRLALLGSNLDAIYGTGLLTHREFETLNTELAQLSENPSIAAYRATLESLSSAAAWADARMHYHLGSVITRLMTYEPKVNDLVADRLRGSALLLHGRLLEQLSSDGDQLAGIRHEVFGQPVSQGLRALNPGIARGPLRELGALESYDDGILPIVVTDETTSDLPAVAGILTTRAGNSLSHIQLLARNLGIPNVVVSAELLAQIESRLGQAAVLLASPGGVVRLANDGPEWDELFDSASAPPPATTIRVDLERLNLERKDFIDLGDLRASDSGRIVGPKAAKLGELKALFPEQVSSGLAIPFGVFRAMLDRPRAPGGPTIFAWMRQNYLRLATIEDATTRQHETSLFLAELRNWIEGYSFDADSKAMLRQRMQEVFGNDGSYGVFVRSDTNVEDLAGFTGAGLNLTLPNVSGFENILAAIKQVWASPFTERAFGWRQALMDRPEHVYTAVLLHKSVPADKSGVMVTADLATGKQDTLSIAVNEGVSGGVDGQATESLRVDAASGETTLLASAAEPLRKTLPVTGGTALLPASGADRVLTQADIQSLVHFAQSLPARYPKLTDADGNTAPADVEFAFVDGRLSLIQIRPFLQSTKAQRNQALAALDAGFAANIDRRIDLNQPPHTKDMP